MKLNYDRKSKDPTYFIQQGIRNGKKVTTKNVKRIGKHSELLECGNERESSENLHEYTLSGFAGKEKSTDPMIPHQTDASVRDQGLEIFQQPKNRMNRRSTDIIRRVLPKYNHKCYQYV